MLDTFIQQIGKELEMTDFITSIEKGHFKLPFEDNIDVDAFVSPKGNYIFKSIIGDCPKQNVESFFVKAMEANLFGRGTLGATIGLNENGNILTISQEVDYNSSYKEWRDKLEDFINATDFWRKESLNHH